MTTDTTPANFPLRTLQQWMQTVLVNPITFDDGHPAELLPEEYQEGIEKIIAPSSRLTSRQRLAIYQRGYLARLRDCMAGQFKGLQHALGEQLFTAFADEYLQKYPSASYTLADLGSRFAMFLEETRPDKDLPENEREDWPDFMIELAQLEYLLVQAFDATSEEGITYAQADAPDANLRLIPHLHLLSLRFPTAYYLQAVHRNEAPPLPYPQPTFAALTRKDYQLGLFHLNPSQYQLLHFIQNNTGTIPQLIEAFITHYSIPKQEFLEVWPTWRNNWVESGFFCVY